MWHIYDEADQRVFTGTCRECEDWLDRHENIGVFRYHQYEFRIAEPDNAPLAQKGETDE